MTKFVDSLGLKRLVTKIAEAVSNGTWLPVRKGSDNEWIVAEGLETVASGSGSHSEGAYTKATGDYSHAEGDSSTASGYASHAEGGNTNASGDCSHTEGSGTIASGNNSHAQGINNYDDVSFIDMVGVGTTNNKNASVIRVVRDTSGSIDGTDPKNGYQYLLDVGGYKGRAVTEGMKSVQEVITDLEKGVKEASETMTVEDIREIMSV